ncbi:CPW-WPC family protein, putative [Plasmodium malariae]|uniref:CPW-WPC family protein, putative n=1 Tax=Plasmodium malariae TaxID=5858 RepID=A0A1C3L0I1_PLAMA|nr:CPW-WPC family protein, putative [Plasmodium malariae]
MKKFIIFFALSFLNIIKLGVSDVVLNDKKTFVFSGDLNLSSKYSKENKPLEEENENNTINLDIIIKDREKMNESDQNVKNIVNEATNEIKKKYNINQLPSSGNSEVSEMNTNQMIRRFCLCCCLYLRFRFVFLFNLKENTQLIVTIRITQEEEEEAKEESAFLLDDLEEAAQNFSSSDEQVNENSSEKETELKNVKKYQAEVINSMNKDNVYKNFDSDELEKFEQTLKDSEDVCDQDYSLPCPLNFFRTSSGCVPQNSYEGPCNKVHKLMFLYDNQKESWADICGANWPCIPLACPYGTDYDSTCPINWIDIGKGICRSIYINEKCQNDIDFSSTTIVDKKKFEQLCGIRWKCKSVSYITNFESICPLYWTYLYDYKCKSPDDYKGPCPNIINLKKYNTEEGKKNVEIACLVNWPYNVKDNARQRDYSVACPIGWSLMENNMCKAPENYKLTSICNDEVSFVNMNLQQKESYSIACNVDFPFKDRTECKRNYSFMCPMGWIPSNKEGYCKAPIGYKNKICKKQSQFKNISDSQKNYYLKFCNIDWPCEGEIQNSAIYTKLAVDYLTENSTKRDSGPIDSETGIII